VRKLKYIIHKLAKSKKGTIKTEKSDGIALEKIAKYLFCCIEGCQFMENRKITDSSELDLVYRILDPKHPLYNIFGQYLIIECKDWDVKVNSATVRSFLINLISINARGGIIFTVNGITGSALKDAQLEIKKAYHRHGIAILIFDINDMDKILNNQNLLISLYKKYENVLFDVT